MQNRPQNQTTTAVNANLPKALACLNPATDTLVQATKHDGYWFLTFTTATATEKGA